jgi:hypothetical protein
MDVRGFGKELETLEVRIKDFVMSQNKTLQDDLNAHKQELAEQVKYFDEKTTEL